MLWTIVENSSGKSVWQGAPPMRATRSEGQSRAVQWPACARAARVREITRTRTGRPGRRMNLAERNARTKRTNSQKSFLRKGSERQERRQWQ